MLRFYFSLAVCFSSVLFSFSTSSIYSRLSFLVSAFGFFLFFAFCFLLSTTYFSKAPCLYICLSPFFNANLLHSCFLLIFCFTDYFPRSRSAPLSSPSRILSRVPFSLFSISLYLSFSRSLAFFSAVSSLSLCDSLRPHLLCFAPRLSLSLPTFAVTYLCRYLPLPLLTVFTISVISSSLCLVTSVTERSRARQDSWCKHDRILPYSCQRYHHHHHHHQSARPTINLLSDWCGFSNCHSLLYT